MSSRQLRKIRQQQELQKAAGPAKNETPEPEEEEEDEPVAKPRISMFAALGGDDNEDEKVSESDDNEAGAQAEAATPASVTTSSKKNKKKKKKAKKKQVATRTGEETPEKQDGAEDEIDKALKELNIQPRASASKTMAAGSAAESESDTVLHISTHHLRDIHELRQLFGRDAIDLVQQEDREEQRAAQRRLHNRAPRQVDLETFLRGQPGKKLPEISLRHNILIEGKDFWPRDTSGGLSMREVDQDPDGKWVEYTYVHDKQYDKTQMEFFSLVGMGDPMLLVHLLKEKPYHISTLLQVSFFAKQDENQSLAADLCERALFTFGRATLSSFRQNLEKGRARLDYCRPENRQFWLAGYHYLKSLVRKGALRTALEWAKLIFSMDPVDDPYGMTHLIHVLAIKAHESQWLESFIRVFEKSRLHGDMRYYRNTLVLGLLQQQDLITAKARLVENIHDMPWLYCALFQALNLDAPPSIWGVQPPGQVDDFYTALYIYLAKDIWNYPQATNLLKEAANLAAKPKDLKPTDSVLELRIARFVFLEGNTALIGRVPRHYLDRQPNYEFDPLPPSKDANIFSTEGGRIPFEANIGGARSFRDDGGPGPIVDWDDMDSNLDEAFEEWAEGPAELQESDEDDVDVDDDGSGEVERDEPSNFQSIRRFVQETIFGVVPGRRYMEMTEREEGERAPLQPSGLPGSWPVEMDDDSEDEAGNGNGHGGTTDRQS